jgi:predicted Fe-Mo cluster-binding NifX family protein
MKIAVSSSGPSLEDAVDPRFGRCGHFLIVDTETLDCEAVENSARLLSGGSGIEAAERVADMGVTHVLTGRCGPKAEKVLLAAGIRIVEGCSGTVRQAVAEFRSGAASRGARPSSASRIQPGAAGRTGGQRPAAGRCGGRGMGGGGRGMGGGGRGMGGGGLGGGRGGLSRKSGG